MSQKEGRKAILKKIGREREDAPAGYAVGRLELEAVGEFHQEDVMGVDVEQVVDVAAEGEIPPGLEARPALRPDKIERRAGDVFPADDQVGAELEELD